MPPTHALQVDEGLVDTDTAITMVEPTHLDQLLHPQFADESAYKVGPGGTDALWDCCTCGGLW